MERFQCLLAVLLLQCLGTAHASSLRSDSGNSLSIQQQLQLISAGAAAHQPQPQRLAKDVQPDRRFLLSIVRSLQSERTEHHAAAQKASLVQTQEVSLRERQLLSHMGELERQLESWKKDEHKFEQQVAVKQSSSAASPAAPIRDMNALVPFKMLPNHRALLGLALSITISIFFFAVMLRCKSKPRQKERDAPEDSVPTPALGEAGMKMEIQEPMSPEVTKQLADLVAAVKKVQMPSDGAVKVVMQAVECNDSTHDLQDEAVEEPCGSVLRPA